MRLTIGKDDFQHLILGGSLLVYAEAAEGLIEFALQDIGYDVMHDLISNQPAENRLGHVRQLHKPATPQKKLNPETMRSGSLVTEVRFDEAIISLDALGTYLTCLLFSALVRQCPPGFVSAGLLVPGGILSEPDPPAEDRIASHPGVATFQFTVAYDPEQTSEDLLETGLNSLWENALGTLGILDRFGEPVIGELELVRGPAQDAAQIAPDGAGELSAAEAVRKTRDAGEVLQAAQTLHDAREAAHYLDYLETVVLSLLEARDDSAFHVTRETTNPSLLGTTPSPHNVWQLIQEKRAARGAQAIKDFAERSAITPPSPASEPGILDTSQVTTEPPGAGQPKPPWKPKLATPEAQKRLIRLSNMVDQQVDLVEELRYYAWLEEHGVEPEAVKGRTSKIPVSPVIRQELKKSGKRLGKDLTTDVREAVCYQMKDGTEITLPWPPFSRKVLGGITVPP
jgi:hypothetical protein